MKYFLINFIKIHLDYFLSLHLSYLFFNLYKRTMRFPLIQTLFFNNSSDHCIGVLLPQESTI